MDRVPLIHFIERKLQNFRKQTKKFWQEEKRPSYEHARQHLWGSRKRDATSSAALVVAWREHSECRHPQLQSKDLDFKALINNERSMSTRRTHDMHIDHAGGSKNGLIYRVPNNPAADGNTVELNFQQAEFGKESARYTATLQFLENRIGGVRRALRGE